MNYSPWFLYENFISSTKNMKNSYLIVKINLTKRLIGKLDYF